MDTNYIIDLKKHAYLLSVDDDYTDDIIYNVLDSCAYNDLSESEYLNISNLLKNKSFPDLKFIIPDGKSIKKDQIKSLIADFENKSLYNWKKIYVIQYAEDLNQSSANTLLKFLEEPEDNIVAILLTKNISNVIETIVSRCEIVLLNHYKSKITDDRMIKKVIDFISDSYSFGDKVVAYESELYNFKSEDLKNFLETLLLFYDDIVQFHYFKRISIFNSYLNDIKKLEKNVNLYDIIKKSKKIAKIIQMLDFNVNARVCLDLFFVGDDDEI